MTTFVGGEGPELQMEEIEVDPVTVELSQVGSDAEEISLGEDGDDDRPMEQMVEPRPSRAGAKCFLTMGVCVVAVILLVGVAVAVAHRGEDDAATAASHAETILSYGERPSGDEATGHRMTSTYIKRHYDGIPGRWDALHSQTFMADTSLGPKQVVNLYATSIRATNNTPPCHHVLATHYDSVYSLSGAGELPPSDAASIGALLELSTTLTTLPTPICDITMIYLDGHYKFSPTDAGLHGSRHLAAHWDVEPHLPPLETITSFTYISRIGVSGSKLSSPSGVCGSADIPNEANEVQAFVSSGISVGRITYFVPEGGDENVEIDLKLLKEMMKCLEGWVLDVTGVAAEPDTVRMTREILDFGPRLVGDENTTGGYMKTIQYVKDAVEKIDGFEPIKLHEFTQQTVAGQMTFRNLYTRLSKGVQRAGECHIVLTVHYDSMQHKNLVGFLGATDSVTGIVLILKMLQAVSKHHQNSLYATCAVSAIFFDGEESFVKWTNDDSLYGSRKFAADWAAGDIPGWDGEYRLGDVTEFVLLDLLGSEHCAVPEFQKFLETRDHYQAMVELEAHYNAVNNLPKRIFTNIQSGAGISDDHLPFLDATCGEKCVPVLHLIASPFPRNIWHTINDDYSAVSWPVMAKLEYILTNWIVTAANPPVQRSVEMTGEILSYGTREVDASSGYFQTIEYIKNYVKGLEGWETVKEHTFEEDTVKGRKTFRNLYSKWVPGEGKVGGCHKVVAAHYDSWQSDVVQGFLGATDAVTGVVLVLRMMEALGTEVDAGCAVTAVFFDGEESFERWSKTDSLYGSKKFAADWQAGTIPSLNPLSSVTTFTLLDLLGTPDCQIPYFTATPLPSYSLLSNASTIFTNTYTYRRVEDDHTPFAELGVPVLHLISFPFPSVWHAAGDTFDAVSWSVMSELDTVFRWWIVEEATV